MTGVESAEALRAFTQVSALMEGWWEQNEWSEYPGRPLPPEARGSWYCPCVSEPHAARIAHVLREHGVTRVYDMGAGDLRLSVYLDRLGFEVTAYEIRTDVVEHVMAHVDVGRVVVRTTDMWLDYLRVAEEDPRAAFLFIGGTNLPVERVRNLTIEGYDEIGLKVMKNGKLLHEI